MKKLLMFFGGIILMLVMFVALYLAAGIFDAGSSHTIDTYFFQTNARSSMRLGVPASASDLGDDKMRDMLIKKYVYEYFYVIPDKEDIARRTRPGESTMARLSRGDVFNRWRDGEARVIEELATSGALRMVEVLNPIVKPADSDYWIVNYELKTWYAPNDLNEMPEISRGVILLDIYPATGGYTEIRQSVKDVGAALKSGRDPATLFNFGVIGVELQ